MDMDLSPDVTAELRGFADAVAASPHNLVSRRARGELWTRHVPECVAFAKLLPEGASVLDVGSGGGFPGLVIALVRPDLRVALLEATAKKVEFLREQAVLRGLSDLQVLHGRAEDLQHGELAGRFDVVTARAVAPLAKLIGWTIPFLRPGGVLYAIKGERWQEELDAAVDALRQYGASLVATPDELWTDGGSSPRVVMLQRSRATVAGSEGKM